MRIEEGAPRRTGMNQNYSRTPRQFVQHVIERESTLGQLREPARCRKQIDILGDRENRLAQRAVASEDMRELAPCGEPDCKRYFSASLVDDQCAPSDAR
jgi:hypothetical protein